MYSGMADVALSRATVLIIHAIDKIWENIVSKKYYITGGIGATSAGEAFGKNYDCLICQLIVRLVRLSASVPELPSISCAWRSKIL